MRPNAWAGLLGVSSLVLFQNLAPANAAAKHPLTIDDVLKLEQIGTGSVDPIGRRWVWEQAGRYDRLWDYGTPTLGTWDIRPGLGSSGYRLRYVDMSSPIQQARDLFPPEQRTSYWLDRFSPLGGRLSFYFAHNGHVRIGVFSFANRRVRSFAFSPRINFRNMDSVWLSENELVVATMPAGREAEGLLGRRSAAESLWKAWHSAWAGERSVLVEDSRRAQGNQAQGRLLRLNVETGASIELAQGDFQNLHAAPDGSGLIVTKPARRTGIETAARRQGSPDVETLLVPLAGSRAGQPVLIVEADLGEPAWIPNGSRGALVETPESAAPRVHLFDAANGRVETISLAPAVRVTRRAAWWGDRPIIIAQPGRSSEGQNGPGANFGIFQVEPTGELEPVSSYRMGGNAELISVIGNDAIVRTPDRLLRIPLGSASSSPRFTIEIPEGFSPARATGPIHGDLAGLAFISADRAEVLFANLATGGTRRVRIASGEVITQTFNGFRALSRQRVEAGDQIVLGNGAESRIFAELNRHLANVEDTPWQVISYRRGGERVEACILVPPAFRRGIPRPVILDVYPNQGAPCSDQRYAGRYHAASGLAISRQHHLLAAQGYIVVIPNTLNTALVPDREGEMSTTDAINAAASALVEQGYTQPGMIGLFGFSQGGYLALLAASRSNAYSAVVALDSWTDPYSHYYSSDGLRGLIIPNITGEAGRYLSPNSPFFLGAGPQTDIAPYLANSVLLRARNINAPVLLGHGDLEWFDIAQFEMLYRALVAAGRDVRLLRFLGEGHGPSSPRNIEFLWNSVFAWYAQNLGATQSEKASYHGSDHRIN